MILNAGLIPPLLDHSDPSRHHSVLNAVMTECYYYVITIYGAHSVELLLSEVIYILTIAIAAICNLAASSGRFPGVLTL